ncbi:uncharacterized protein LOC110913808 [Helianthus annuus]|uniref:uncharacterized protein LOC110913808 n=1 Tax=Helianthus annuus TaxID=4232 RepID=UPI000B906A98|nr:uncharacterized protein LOC110913808 [Helianthus annuus]
MTTITTFTLSHNSYKFAFTLSPINYGYWKTMIEPFLIKNNLFGYIDGSIPCPASIVITTFESSYVFITNPNYQSWIAKDEHVRMIIISTIPKVSFAHVQGSTAKELWDFLVRAYAPHIVSKEYTLKTQLLKLQMKGDETPLAYLSRAQEIAYALANIGEPVKNKDLVLHVICGLRYEYNGFKTNILAFPTPLAFNELYGLLTDHDYMVTEPPQPTNATTFVTSTTPAQSP